MRERIRIINIAFFEHFPFFVSNERSRGKRKQMIGVKYNSFNVGTACTTQPTERINILNVK